jgi:diguanylate cyclase (GGDEF)-like protein
MDLYALSDEINRLYIELPQLAGADRVDVVISLAWYLRQLDSRQSMAFVSEAEILLNTHTSCSSEWLRSATCRLALIRAEIAALFQEFDRAEQLLLEARCGFVALADISGEGDSCLLEAIISLEQGDVRRAVLAAKSAASYFERSDTTLRKLLAQAWYVYLLAFVDPSEAKIGLMSLLASVNEVKHPALAGLVAAAQGELLFTSELARSAVMYSQASELARQAGLIRLAIMSACNAGVALQKLGALDAAASNYDWAVSRARKTAWPVMIAFTLIRLGELLRHLNRLEQSQQVLEEALQGLAGRKSGIYLAIAHAELGSTLLLRGLSKDAASYFDTAIKLYREAGSRHNLCEHLISQARAFSAAGESMSALAAIAEAGALIDELSLDTLQVDLREALAEIHGRCNSLALPDMQVPTLALHYLEQALCVGSGVDGWMASSSLLLSLAEAWSQAGDGQQAFSYAKQAIAADRRERSNQAENLTSLMQVRHETESAKAEAMHHQQLAAVSLATSQTLDLLATVGQEITADLNFKNVCHSLQSHLGSLLGAADLCIWLIDPGTKELMLSYCAEGDITACADLLRSDRNVANATLCITQRQEMLLTTDVANLSEGEVDLTSARTMLFGPLIVGESALGVMAIQSVGSIVYGERARLIFRSLCAYGAIALDNAHAHDQLQETQKQLKQALLDLEETSLTDPLTGLKNRRFLIQHIDADVAQSVRHYQDTSGVSDVTSKDADLLIFLVDLDHFKQINDKYGHAAGDAVLVQIRERLQQVFRDSDYLIRWGGEEFLIVARGTTRDIAAELAERVRLVVAEHEFHLDGELRIQQTCSVGFACFPFVTAHPRAISWQDVIDIADIALYSVKHSGRNGWVGIFAEQHAWPELLLCTLKNDPKGAILNKELLLSTNKAPEQVIDALAKKQSAI